MQVDYLIIGQGLCGTWLSYYLMKAGASVLVLDNGVAKSASATASGIINPITGKRLARQWMGETIQSFAEAAYSEMSEALGQTFARESAIHTFFSNADEATFFERKAATTHEDVLSFNASIAGDEAFNQTYGSGTIHPALLVDVPALLSVWRMNLSGKGALREEAFDWSLLELKDTVQYKDFTAKALIDCSGAASAFNSYFSKLPFALNKGEAIIASIPGLPRNAVYKYHQLSIVPCAESQFWLGSTFDWDFADVAPTATFRQKVDITLGNWLKLPYTLHEHFAAIRPATVTRDAFAGLHPIHPQVGILNGMGSKGCSLAPFLAHNLAQHLLHGAPMLPQVDVGRYGRALSR